MWKITRLIVDIIHAQREITRLRRALFKAAALVESRDCSCQIDSFFVNGAMLSNRQGYEKFISTEEMTRILRQRAETIRWMALEGPSS